MARPAKTTSVALLAALLFLPCTSQAGKLSKFKDEVEQEQVRQEPEQIKTTKEKQKKAKDELLDDVSDTLEVVGFFLSLGGSSSEEANTTAKTQLTTAEGADKYTGTFSAEDATVAQANSNAFQASPPPAEHELGSPRLPFFQFDASSQYIDDMEVFDYRLELGYGPVAIYYNRTNYTEDASGTEPKERLTMERSYVIYRMPLSQRLEAGFGLGAMTIDDAKIETEASLTVPVRMLLTEGVNAEFRYSWTETLDDYDLAVSYTPGFVSLKLGYHWLQGPGSSLNGPYAGIAVHF